MRMKHAIAAPVLLALAACASAATPPTAKTVARTFGTQVVIHVVDWPSYLRLQDPKGRLVVVRDFHLIQNDIPGADVGPGVPPRGQVSLIVTLVEPPGGLWRLTVTASASRWPSFVHISRSLERGDFCEKYPFLRPLPADSTATWDLSWSGEDARDTCWVKAVPVPTDSGAR